MRRLGSFIAALLVANAYGAGACSSDEETPSGGSGAHAGAAGSSAGRGSSVGECLPRSCCKDGVVTTTYAPCEKLTTYCALGCREDLGATGCVATNNSGDLEDATAWAESLCIGSGSAGKGGAGAGGGAGTGAGGTLNAGAGGEGGASDGGMGGESGASDGGMGGQGPN